MFTEFPSLQRKGKVGHSRNQVVILIFCECRQQESGRMVQCDQGQEWFHDDYVTVPDVVWKGNNISWLYQVVTVLYFCKK